MGLMGLIKSGDVYCFGARAKKTVFIQNCVGNWRINSDGIRGQKYFFAIEKTYGMYSVVNRR